LFTSIKEWKPEEEAVSLQFFLSRLIPQGRSNE